MEGDAFADKLDNHGHTINGVVCWDLMHSFIRKDILHDQFNFISYRFS